MCDEVVSGDGKFDFTLQSDGSERKGGVKSYANHSPRPDLIPPPIRGSRKMEDEIDLLLTGKEWKPFVFLFEQISPEGFAVLFENEAAQTRAFLLSFAPCPKYVEAVLNKYNDDEFTDLVTDYVSRVEGESADVRFIRCIEKHIRGITGASEKNRMGTIRKNMILKKGEGHENWDKN